MNTSTRGGNAEVIFVLRPLVAAAGMLRAAEQAAAAAAVAAAAAAEEVLEGRANASQIFCCLLMLQK